MNENTLALRKAAVLLASLDAATAEKLLGQFSPQLAERIRATLATLGPIDPLEQDQVIDEFRRGEIRAALAEAPGIELADSLKNKIRRSPEETSVVDDAPQPGAGVFRQPVSRQPVPWQPDSAPPFGFLHEADPRDLAPTLEGEHPQTIALVVSHLPPNRAAELLGALPADLQSQVVRRLLDQEKADPEMVREVELAIEARLQDQTRRQRARAGGLATLADILRAADQQTQAAIVGNVARHDPRLGSLLARPPKRLASLDELDDESLLAVFDTADPALAVLALAGSSNDFLLRVLRLFPARQAQQVRRALSNLGPTRLDDLEQAKAALVELARRMANEGRARRRAHELNAAA